MKVAAVVPAYNEERWIGPVLECLSSSNTVDEIIVVCDGSTDNTCEKAAGYSRVKAIKLPQNMGKGGAMVAGAKASDAEIIMFFDGDLIGLKPSHVEALVRPVLDGKADMAIGAFRGGRLRTDWAQRIAPYISGQRAMRREDFLEIPDLESTRFGVEVAIGRFARYRKFNIAMVPIMGVTHPMKEEKVGYLRGTVARLKMYWDIMKLTLNLQSRKSKVESQKVNADL